MVSVRETRGGGGGSERERVLREGVCARDRVGGGGVRVSFRKMVYEKIGRKPFFVFLQSIFRSTEMVFSLTSILHKTNISKY